MENAIDITVVTIVSSASQKTLVMSVNTVTTEPKLTEVLNVKLFRMPQITVPQ